MAKVSFTPHLQLHLDCPSTEASGETVRELLNHVFESNPRLRGYLLDDQHRLRQHVVIFIDDQVIRDRVRLSDPVSSESEVYVLQALSGG